MIASVPSRAERSTDGMSNAAALILSLFEYKAWADTQLMEAVLAAKSLSATTEGGYVTMIIRHFHTVDSIFKAHLLGVPHQYDSTNPGEPATLSELQPRVREVDDWYVEYVRNVDEQALSQHLNIRFTDGQQQLLTRSDMLVHVCLHAAGHRGQVALLLKKCGVEPPPDRFTNYLRE
jgi:uncharacterized damage-inducible protein DinB